MGLTMIMLRKLLGIRLKSSEGINEPKNIYNVQLLTVGRDAARQAQHNANP